MDEQAERAAFAEWAGNPAIDPWDADAKKDQITVWAWQAWKARANLSIIQLVQRENEISPSPKGEITD